MDTKLPSEFRKDNSHHKGKCNSVFCHGAEWEESVLIKCRKCEDILHCECLGMTYKASVPKYFACSGCKKKHLYTLNKDKYIYASRKLRRNYSYLKLIAVGALSSWRTKNFIKGGKSRMLLKYNVYFCFPDEEMEEIIKKLTEWMSEWNSRKLNTDDLKFCLDVLLPEAIIKIIMDAEGIHRDHAEYLYCKSLF